MLLSHFVRVILQFGFKFLAFFRAWTPVLIISSDSFPAPRSLYFYSCLLFRKPASSGHGHGSCCDWKHASQLTYLKLQLRLGRPRLPFLSVRRHSLSQSRPFPLTGHSFKSHSVRKVETRRYVCLSRQASPVFLPVPRNEVPFSPSELVLRLTLLSFH